MKLHAFIWTKHYGNRIFLQSYIYFISFPIMHMHAYIMYVCMRLYMHVVCLYVCLMHDCVYYVCKHNHPAQYAAWRVMWSEIMPPLISIRESAPRPNIRAEVNYTLTMHPLQVSELARYSRWTLVDMYLRPWIYYNNSPRKLVNSLI